MCCSQGMCDNQTIAHMQCWGRTCHEGGLQTTFCLPPACPRGAPACSCTLALLLLPLPALLPRDPAMHALPPAAY
jgi:hypothetical protein